MPLRPECKRSSGWRFPINVNSYEHVSFLLCHYKNKYHIETLVNKSQNNYLKDTIRMWYDKHILYAWNDLWTLLATFCDSPRVLNSYFVWNTNQWTEQRGDNGIVCVCACACACVCACACACVCVCAIPRSKLRAIVTTTGILSLSWSRNQIMMVVHVQMIITLSSSLNFNFQFFYLSTQSITEPKKKRTKRLLLLFVFLFLFLSDFHFFQPEYQWRYMYLSSRNAHLVHQNWYVISVTV
jgi:hypothetical protein